MFECHCGFVCGNQLAYREHRKACMSYAPPKAPPPVEDESARPMDFDGWLMGCIND